MTTIETTQSRHSLNFRAMNTDIEIIIFANDDTVITRQRMEQASKAVNQLFNEVEERLSRFRPESELSRLNRDGCLTNASPILFESVQAALAMAELTNGIFDPTILESLEKAGYNRSFELLFTPTFFSTPRLAPLPSDGRYRAITLEPNSRTIMLPAGLRLDLGGIGKGITVDRASRLLKEAGFNNFVVSAGGDMFLSGCPPLEFDGWTVGVSNPLKPDEDLTEITGTNCAVATSSVTKRRWLQGNQVSHHLIDPRTGRPVVNQLAAVTVTAPTTQLADVLAKTALILGIVKGKAFIQQQLGCSAIFVTMNEEIIY